MAGRGRQYRRLTAWPPLQFCLDLTLASESLNLCLNCFPSISVPWVSEAPQRSALGKKADSDSTQESRQIKLTPTETDPGYKAGPRAWRPTEKALLFLSLTERLGKEIESKDKQSLNNYSESSRNGISTTTILLFYPLRN